MAIDYFISYSQTEKVALLRGLTESMLTGQIVEVKTANSEITKFNPNIDNSLMYQRLCDSIANDPEYNADDAIQARCKDNQRVGITRPRFC